MRRSETRARVRGVSARECKEPMSRRGGQKGGVRWGRVLRANAGVFSDSPIRRCGALLRVFGVIEANGR
jgi:hypothetical protein